VESHYKTILEKVGDAVICIDTDSGQVIHANKWASKLTGLNQGESITSSPVSSDLSSLGWLQEIIQEARHRETVRTCAIWESPEFSRSKNRLLDIFVTQLNGGDSRIAILMRTINTDRAIEKKLWRRNHELHLLNHASRTVSRSLNPQKVAQMALELSLNLLEARAGIAYLSDFQKQALVPVAFSGLSETVELSELGFNGRQEAVTTFNAGEPFFHTSRCEGGQIPLEKCRYSATIPLQTNESVLGVLEIALEDMGFPGVECDIALLSSFGFQVGIALDNALLHKKVEDESRIDGLTRIYTRQYLETLLEDQVKRGVRYGECFATLMVDIDRFKSINDVHGHEVGDQVIKKVVGVLEDEVRETDYLGRWGGEEFLIILSHVGWEEAVTISERIRLQVAALSFMEVCGAELPITVCVGVACYPDHSESSDGLVRCADNAMRFAKRSGRNRTQLFSEDMDNMPTEYSRNEINWTTGMETIRALAAALDAKDSYTASHSEAVKMLSVKIAEQMHLNEEHRDILERAGLLHDIGKVAIPDSLLNKPGVLNHDEWAIIREHPRMGVLILKEAPQLAPIIPVVLHHHENFDGTGYPQGIAGQNIPMLSRILRVADTFMAMVSTRPYRKALSPEEAWHSIEQASGRLFDPVIVEALAKTLSEGKSAP
jgi:diguanylate cyclase (GGDEF)-like protein/putative nucleotidyltransferase with HDIG domain